MQKVLILGFGIEGRSAAEFFLGRGEAHVAIFDVQPESALGDESVATFRARGVEFFCGSASAPVGDFDLCVRSPGVPLHAPALVEMCGRSVPITTPTQIFFEECAARNIVGVTGTKGKGTTSSLIYAIVHAAGLPVVLCGNIGVPMLSLLPKISADTVVVLELSSGQLMDVTHSPHIAVVLMTTADHLDFHADEAEYVAAKKNIAKFQRSEDVIVYNEDYENSRAIAAASGAHMRIGVSAAQASGVELTPTQLPGRHNVENICAAVAVAHVLGVSDENIVGALREFRGLEHRLELVSDVGGVRYYNDSFATNPSSTIAAVCAFDANAHEILILGGSHKGSEFDEMAAVIAVRAAQDGIRAIIGVGMEWPRIRAALVGGGVSENLFIEGCNTMDAIVAAAHTAARSGDVVLLSPACASFDMFLNYKQRGAQFKECVARL